MGISILTQPKKGSALKIADILWLLAAFGIVHGMNEWLDMWSMIKYRTHALDLARLLCLISSFIFLFEFGKRLFMESIDRDLPSRRKRTVGYLSWAVYLIIGIFIFFNSSQYHDFWNAGSIWARYLLAFPGALLTGFGFLYYFRHEEKILKQARVTKYFLLSGLSFAVYGILTGLVVPKGDFFPANWLNTNSFLSTIHIPVQVFRTGVAIVGALAVNGMIKFFDWETRKKLEEALVTDELTGVYNRRGFLTMAEQQMKTARRLEKGVLLLSADMDNIKIINDTFGHKEGDSTLIHTANVLKESFRESDIVGRIGGDEFVVFQMGNTDNTPERLTERLQKNLDIHNAETGRKYKLSISVGIVRCDSDCTYSLDELLTQADKLMYERKMLKEHSS
jgi:diguanylate cyclase (GGDEF)-like protein